MDMNNDNPIMNTDRVEPNTVVESMENLDTNQGLVSMDQLNFDVDTPSQRVEQILNGLKMFITKRNEMLELSMLWKTPAFPFAIISMIINVAILLLGGLLKFSQIPPKIPFFYDAIDKHWEPVDKSIIFILPFALFFLELFILNFTISIFKYDRRLSITICWILTLLNIIALVIIGQIYILTT